VISRATTGLLGDLVDLVVIAGGNLSSSCVADGPSSAMVSFDTSGIQDVSVENRPRRKKELAPINTLGLDTDSMGSRGSMGCWSCGKQDDQMMEKASGDHARDSTFLLQSSGSQAINGQFRTIYDFSGST